jgi:hypothetical protein
MADRQFGATVSLACRAGFIVFLFCTLPKVFQRYSTNHVLPAQSEAAGLWR